ncbi:hypothetical protein R6Q57_008594 [Mikania cordata]
MYNKFQKNGSISLPLEFDYSNQFRAVGENYQLFVRLVSNKHYFDLQQYHNTEYWEGIKQQIQEDCANRYKDRKTKLKNHFDWHGSYDNTERAKTKPPEGMDPDAWV